MRSIGRVVVRYVAPQYVPPSKEALAEYDRALGREGWSPWTRTLWTANSAGTDTVWMQVGARTTAGVVETQGRPGPRGLSPGPPGREHRSCRGAAGGLGTRPLPPSQVNDGSGCVHAFDGWSVASPSYNAPLSAEIVCWTAPRTAGVSASGLSIAKSWMVWL